MPGPARGLGERVEVDDDELERRDAGGGDRLAVVGAPSVREQAGVDVRVERLDAAVEHLGEAGDRDDVRDRQAGVAQRPGGPPGAHELEAPRDEPGAERREARLVVGGEQGPARDRRVRVEGRRIEARPAGARLHGERPGEERGHGTGKQPVLRRVEPLEQGGLVVVGEHGHGLLRHDRPAVEGRVDEVHGHAGDGHAGGERVADRVQARERRQQRRVDVEDPAVEPPAHRRPDDPEVAGKHDGVGRHGCQRVGQDRVVAARHEHGVDPLLRRPVERRARTVGEHERDLAAERAARRPPRRAPAGSSRVPDTPTAIRPSVTRRSPRSARRRAPRRRRPPPRPRRRSRGPRRAPRCAHPTPRGRPAPCRAPR